METFVGTLTYRDEPNAAEVGVRVRRRATDIWDFIDKLRVLHRACGESRRLVQVTARVAESD